MIRRSYRTVEEALLLVEWSMTRAGTQRVIVEPGMVHIQQTEGAAGLEPGPELPGDNLLERIRTAQGIGIGHISAIDRRDALMIALAFCQQQGLIPTHFLCSDRIELHRLLVLCAPGDDGFVETGTIFGWEIVEERTLPEGTIFLCGGPRRGGKMSDVTAAIRLEAQND